MTDALALWLDERAHPEPMSGCWLWLGCKNNQGYGKVSFRSALTYAHRAAFAIAHGIIPAGSQVLHTCDNKACVNPGHLYAGSRSDNARDAFARGRWWPRPIYGERHHNAKLTEANVAAIRARYAAGETNKAALGREYGVSDTLVRYVVTRRAWRGGAPC